jgi:hypothetical protein
MLFAMDVDSWWLWAENGVAGHVAMNRLLAFL